jgi:hypothetical protein
MVRADSGSSHTRYSQLAHLAHSDLVIVAVEASAVADAAELVTLSQARVSQALERIRQLFAVTHPRWEPYAGKPHVRFWAGGVR